MKTLTDFQKQLDKLKSLSEGLPPGGYRRGITALLNSVQIKLDWIKREEEQKALRGKDYFDKKDGVKPDTKVIISDFKPAEK